jgi:hypothetical protein
VTEVLGRRLWNTNIPAPASPQEQLLIETTMIGVRQIIAQARAIAVLVAEVGPVDVAYANLRAIHEQYLDLKYLLLGDAREQQRNALRIHLYAMHDVVRYMPTLGFDASRMARIQSELDRWLALDPELAAEVQAEWRRRRRPSHWSGKTRTDTMRIVDPNPNRSLNAYKFLSWMAHPFTAAVLPAARRIPGHTSISGAFGNKSDARMVCQKATLYVLRSWRVLKKQGWFQQRSK